MYITYLHSTECLYQLKVHETNLLYYEQPEFTPRR